MADDGGRRLLCVGGAPGAGKSTLGALAARAAGAALVDLDSVTTPLVEEVAAVLGEVADLDRGRYAGLREARYRCLAGVAADCLRSGADVVAVAPFTREASSGAGWRAWGVALGARSVTTCWLEVDPGAAARRTAERALPRDRAKAGVRPSGAAPVDRQGVDLVLDTSETASEDLAARLLEAWRHA